MSTSQTPDLLNTLQSELTNREFTAATETLTQLSEAYTTGELKEKIAVEKANALQSRDDISDALGERLTEFERQHERLDLTRMSILGGVGFYLIDPTQGSLSTVTSNVASAVETETAFYEQLTTLSEELSGVELSPELTFGETEFEESVIFVGDSTSLTVDVQNLGGSPASELTLEVAGDTVAVRPSSQTLDDIAAESRASASVTVSSSTDGVHDLSVSVSSSNAGTASTTATLSVTTPKETLENRVSDLEELKETVRESSLPRGVQQGLVAKLDASIDSVDRALQGVTRDGRGGQPPEKALNPAINQLGAYLNQLNAVSSKLSDAYELRLRTGGETNVEELASVRASLG